MSVDFQFEFLEHFAFLNNHLLCYWHTIHNSISKSCAEFQVLSSHFFEVDEHWAKIVRSKNILTAIYVEWNEMNQSKVCVEEFSNIVSCFDIQLEQSKNDNPTRKKSAQGSEILRVIYRFFW